MTGRFKFARCIHSNLTELTASSVKHTPSLPESQSLESFCTPPWSLSFSSVLLQDMNGRDVARETPTDLSSQMCRSWLTERLGFHHPCHPSRRKPTKARATERRAVTRMTHWSSSVAPHHFFTRTICSNSSAYLSLLQRR